jgi:hypothetical protein
MLYEHIYQHPELLEESIRREQREHELIVEALAAHDRMQRCSGRWNMSFSAAGNWRSTWESRARRWNHANLNSSRSFRAQSSPPHTQTRS